MKQNLLVKAFIFSFILSCASENPGDKEVNNFRQVKVVSSTQENNQESTRVDEGITSAVQEKPLPSKLEDKEQFLYIGYFEENLEIDSDTNADQDDQDDQQAAFGLTPIKQERYLVSPLLSTDQFNKPFPEILKEYAAYLFEEEQSQIWFAKLAVGLTLKEVIVEQEYFLEPPKKDLVYKIAADACYSFVYTPLFDGFILSDKFLLEVVSNAPEQIQILSAGTVCIDRNYTIAYLSDAHPAVLREHSNTNMINLFKQETALTKHNAEEEGLELGRTGRIVNFDGYRGWSKQISAINEVRVPATTTRRIKSSFREVPTGKKATVTLIRNDGVFFKRDVGWEQGLGYFYISQGKKVKVTTVKTEVNGAGGAGSSRGETVFVWTRTDQHGYKQVLKKRREKRSKKRRSGH